MKSVIYLIIVSSILSACVQKSNTAPLYLNREGVWHILEKQDDNFYVFGFAYISDGSFWCFDTRKFPSLMDSNLVIRKDSIFQNGGLKYLLTGKDSINVILKKVDGLGASFPKELLMDRLSDNVNDQLDRMLKGDSVAKRIIGSWKLQTASSSPFNLPESHFYYRNFIVTFNSNREAVFYTDNKQDSTIVYDWEPMLNGVSLSIGCIRGLSCGIEPTSDSTITMFERKSYNNDTTYFYLKRVDPRLNHLR